MTALCDGIQVIRIEQSKIARFIADSHGTFRTTVGHSIIQPLVLSYTIPRAHSRYGRGCTNKSD